MVKLFLSLLALFPSVIMAQNQYFFGLDLGPKYDQYKLATGGSRPYSPSLTVRNDVGAMFGAAVGVLIEDKYLLETGIYRSNYRAVFEILNNDGQAYFINTPINTFTAYLVPVIFSVRKPITREKGVFLNIGGGISTMVGTKLGLTEVYYSHAEPVDPEDLSKGNIAYTVLDNNFDAKIITLNFNTSLYYPVNEAVAATLTFAGRLGVSGNNYVDIEHDTPDFTKVKNSLYTSGTGFQFQFGFRYFFTKED